jgi:hypothetical protein
MYMDGGKIQHSLKCSSRTMLENNVCHNFVWKFKVMGFWRVSTALAFIAHFNWLHS